MGSEFAGSRVRGFEILSGDLRPPEPRPPNRALPNRAPRPPEPRPPEPRPRDRLLSYELPPRRAAGIQRCVHVEIETRRVRGDVRRVLLRNVDGDADIGGTVGQDDRRAG